jgi:hypothetical protein
MESARRRSINQPYDAPNLPLTSPASERPKQPIQRIAVARAASNLSVARGKCLVL